MRKSEVSLIKSCDCHPCNRSIVLLSISISDVSIAGRIPAYLNALKISGIVVNLQSADRSEARGLKAACIGARG